MEYQEKDFYINNIDSKINNINTCFKNINAKIKQYNTKYNIINEQIEMLNNKTHLKLHDNTKLLKFQNNLIFNEINYLKNLKQRIQNELNSELYKLSDKLTMISISIINLNKDINHDTITQIKKSKKTDTFLKIINKISNNFNHIKELLLKIKKYNQKMNKDMMKGNYHCKTLDMDITIKRIHIFIEYKRYANVFTTIIDYFSELAETINNQFINKSMFAFLVSDDDNTIVEKDIQKKLFSRVPSLENIHVKSKISIPDIQIQTATDIESSEDDIPMNNIESKEYHRYDSNVSITNFSEIDADNTFVNDIEDI